MVCVTLSLNLLDETTDKPIKPNDCRDKYKAINHCRGSTLGKLQQTFSSYQQSARMSNTSYLDIQPEWLRTSTQDRDHESENCQQETRPGNTLPFWTTVFCELHQQHQTVRVSLSSEYSNRSWINLVNGQTNLTSFFIDQGVHVQENGVAKASAIFFCLGTMETWQIFLFFFDRSRKESGGLWIGRSIIENHHDWHESPTCPSPTSKLSTVGLELFSFCFMFSRLPCDVTRTLITASSALNLLRSVFCAVFCLTSWKMLLSPVQCSCQCSCLAPFESLASQWTWPQFIRNDIGEFCSCYYKFFILFLILEKRSRPRYELKKGWLSCPSLKKPPETHSFLFCSSQILDFTSALSKDWRFPNGSIRIVVTNLMGAGSEKEGTEVSEFDKAPWSGELEKATRLKRKKKNQGVRYRKTP